MKRSTDLKQQLLSIKQSIHDAERLAQRPKGSVELLAVSKTKPASDIQSLYDLGQLSFGENYVQEAVDKIVALSALPIEWHYVGSIQSNKTKIIAAHFDWVHTVDREKIATRLNDVRTGEPLNILIQVNVDKSEGKSGVHPIDLNALTQTILNLPNLRLRGLMSIPNPTNESELRQAHQDLKQLFEDIKRNHPENGFFDTLSMGMTNDLGIAIKEGSSMVRIGTALFGARSPRKTL